jgi:hypothetical protein
MQCQQFDVSDLHRILINKCTKIILGILCVNAEFSTNVLSVASASISRVDMNPDDGNQTGLRNIGFCLNIDAADTSRL